MYRFLAKLGRLRYAKIFMPGIGLTASSSYLLWHLLGTEVIVNFYTVRDGTKAKQLSEKINLLIDKVTNDCRDKVSRIKLESEDGTRSLRWFLSAIPIYAGVPYGLSGCIAGIPVNFEYETPRDIPEDQLNLTPLPFFKIYSDNKSDDEEDDEEMDEKLNPNTGKPKSHKLDINTENGKSYISSLLLSDNAKKFLIARQIFYTDCYQILLNTTNIAIACLFPVSLSRVVIDRIEPFKRSVPRRVYLYMLAGTYGFMQFLLAKDIIQTYFDEQSDSKAASLGRDYLEGGVEYYRKFLQRNIAVRNTNKVFDSVIDEKGNLKSGFIFGTIRTTELPPTKRLELLVKQLENAK